MSPLSSSICIVEHDDEMTAEGAIVRSSPPNIEKCLNQCVCTPQEQLIEDQLKIRWRWIHAENDVEVNLLLLRHVWSDGAPQAVPRPHSINFIATCDPGLPPPVRPRPSSL